PSSPCVDCTMPTSPNRVGPRSRPARTKAPSVRPRDTPAPNTDHSAPTANRTGTDGPPPVAACVTRGVSLTAVIDSSGSSSPAGAPGDSWNCLLHRVVAQGDAGRIGGGHLPEARRGGRHRG